MDNVIYKDKKQNDNVETIKRTIGLQKKSKILLGTIFLGLGILSSTSCSSFDDEFSIKDTDNNNLLVDQSVKNLEVGFSYDFLLDARIAVRGIKVINNTANATYSGSYNSHGACLLKIQAKNEGFISFNPEFTSGISSKEYTLYFGYYLTCEAKFIDEDGNLVSSFTTKRNESITAPAYNDKENVCWSDGTDFYRPNEKLYINESKVFDLVEMPLTCSKGLKFLDINDKYVKVDGYNGFETNVVVPGIYEEKIVTEIGSNAFSDKQIESITLPGTVLTLKESCFANSTINSITFSNDSKLKSIGKYAFNNCTNLVKLDLVNTKLETIYDYAFVKCENLEYGHFPSSLKTIESGVFNKCTKANVLFEGTEVSNLKYGWYGYYVGTWNSYEQQDVIDYSFGIDKVEENDDFQYAITKTGDIEILKYKNTSYLKKIDFSNFEKGNVIKIFPKAFAAADINEIIGGDSLKTIGYSAFEASTIEVVHFNGLLAEIGIRAFKNCTNIKDIDFTSTKLEKIGQYAFQGCTSMEYMLLPSTLDTIDTGAFNECKKLNILFESAVYPSNLKYGWYGYYEGTWNNYEQQDVVDISCSIKEVKENDDFQYAIKNDNSIVILKYKGNNDDVLTLDYIDEMPIVKICSQAFYESNIKDLKIGKYVKEIDSYAFYKSTVKHIEIEEQSQLKYIGQYSFSMCASVRSIDLINCSELKTIDAYAFYKSSALYYLLPMNLNKIESMAFASDNAHILFEGLDYSNISSLSSTWLGDSSSNLIRDISYNIESVIDDNEALYAIRHDDKAVLLEARYKYISNDQTQEIKYIGGHKIYKIANYAFKSVFSSISSNSVKHLVLGNSIVEIGDGAFSDCSNLLTVNFDEDNNSIKKLGARAFYNCTSLRAVFIPKSIKSIGSNCFLNDTKCFVLFEISNNVGLELASNWNGYDSKFLIFQTKNSIYRSVCDIKSWSYTENSSAENDWYIIVNYNNSGSEVLKIS